VLFTASEVRIIAFKNLNTPCSIYLLLFFVSQGDYADKVISIFDPEGKYIHHRLYRQHCTVINGHYYKDLSRLGRSLAHTIIVDNSVQAFGL